MNVNFELYHIFYVIAKNESISKAANELYISQPAVTQSLKKLEDQLEVSLFRRNKYGVTLTTEGEIFYDYIKHGVENFRNGETKLSNLKNLNIGNIRIGTSRTITKYILLPYLQKFKKFHPNIDITVTNDLTRNLLKMLKLGSLDMVILNLPIEESNDIEVIPFKTTQDCFIVNKDFISLTKKPMPIEDLNKHPLVLQKQPSSTRKFLDDFISKNSTATLSANIELGSYTLVIDFAKIGMGIGFATKEYLKEELKTKELYEIKTTPSIPKRKVGVAIMKNNIQTFATKELLRLILNN